MARRQELPRFEQKRKVLFGQKTSPAKMRQAGEDFMRVERYDEALEFFQRAEADDLTRQVADSAMEVGNTPLYMRAKKVLGEEITEAEWLQLAGKAESAGLLSGAYLAYVKAGREDEVARLRLLLPGVGARAQDEPAPSGSDAPALEEGAPGEG